MGGAKEMEEVFKPCFYIYIYFTLISLWDLTISNDEEGHINDRRLIFLKQRTRQPKI